MNAWLSGSSAVAAIASPVPRPMVMIRVVLAYQAGLFERALDE